MVNSEQREAAIAWLNLAKKERSFDNGVRILELSGYKPGVVRRLKNIGESEVNMMHLTENLRCYLQHLGKDIPDSDPELGVLDGHQPRILLCENDDKDSLLALADKYEAEKEKSMPSSVGSRLVEYAAAYRKRELLHRKMAEVGEDNDAENIAKRKALSDEMDTLTERLETIYPEVKDYLELGIAPKDDEQVDDKDDDKDSCDDDTVSDYDSMTKDELKKLLKSARTKILRKNNMLLYQQETKAEAENPMPESPKRVKYENRIMSLAREVEQIEYAIARKG